MADEKFLAATMRLEKTSGTVSVTSGGAAQTIQIGMRLTDGTVVQSAEKSECYISLDGTRAVKVCASSEVKITKSGTRLELVKVTGEIVQSAEAPEGAPSKSVTRGASGNSGIATSSNITGVRGRTVHRPK